jgi:asparagine synthetase B (glutamine-hydrolysing)
MADCVLLLAGLDTLIVTAVASRHRRLIGVTVSLNNAPDVWFASPIANEFQLKHLIVEIDEADAESAASEVVCAHHQTHSHQGYLRGNIDK